MSRYQELKKNLFGGTTSNARQFGMIFTLVAIVLLFQVLTDGLTLTSGNLIAVVSQYSYILILAVGMLMVIVAGHIDLSVGSVAAFTGIVVAKAMQEYDLPWPAAIVFGLLVGALIGAWQGFWVAYAGVPAFIVTLAGMLLFRGANQYVGNADTVPVPEGFRKIGAGYLPEIGPDTGYNNPTLLLGLAACVAVVWREWRARQVRQQMDADLTPLWVSGIRLAVMLGVIVFTTLRFAGGRVGTSLPISGIILAALVIAYSFYTRNAAGRAAHLRGRRQRPRRRAVGGEAPPGELLRDDEHGDPRRAGRHDLRGPVRRLRTAGRPELGAGRDRGGVHRRRRRLRRPRHHQRLDRRRPGHGPAQQRPATGGRRLGPGADHQGPGAPARRRAGRLQQPAGPLLGHRIDHASVPAGRRTVVAAGRDAAAVSRGGTADKADKAAATG
ncbi:hypothetical protein LUX39_08565 [Actinomadura madurae]|nr:hypothetical protein [Actinomadura madurae]MCQ0013828.1 hypothetical protein [Actinomadura madurae]